MNNEIIVVKQLPIIEEQLQAIKADVAPRVDAALRLVCTEDTVKTVKEVRAALNKEFKDLEDKRKQVKAVVLAPYEQFEAVYKDCVTEVYRNADNALRGKIDFVEGEIKDRKREEVAFYFEELREANGLDFLTFEMAKINITLSASMKSLKEQAKAFVDRVCDDLALIETQEHKEEILYEYKQSLNVSAAITMVSNRYKAIEEAKEREAEQRRVNEEAVQNAFEKIGISAREAAANVAAAAKALTQPTVEEKPLTVSFKVTATRSKLKELKAFLNNGGYDYE